LATFTLVINVNILMDGSERVLRAIE